MNLTPEQLRRLAALRREEAAIYEEAAGGAEAERPAAPRPPPAPKKRRAPRIAPLLVPVSDRDQAFALSILRGRGRNRRDV